MKQIAIVAVNMVQYYSAVPLMKILEEESISYDLIIPHYDDAQSLKEGWGSMESDMETVLTQKKVDYIKGYTQEDYLICLSTYPTQWEPKACFKIAYNYGYAMKPTFSIAPENNLPYDVILCYGKPDAEYFSVFAKTCIVGEPKMLAYHRTSFPHKKPILLYLPTYSDNSSILQAIPQMKKLAEKYEIIAKAHHGTSALESETEKREMLVEAFSKVYDAKTPLYDLLCRADVVLSDNSGAIYDALAAGVPVARFSQVIPKTFDGFVPYYLELAEKGILPSTGDPDKIDDMIQLAMTEQIRTLQRMAAEELYENPEQGKRNFIKLIQELILAQEKPRLFSIQCSKNQYIEKVKCDQKYQENMLKNLYVEIEQMKVHVQKTEEELAQNGQKIEAARVYILNWNNRRMYKMFCILEKFIKLFLLGKLSDKRYFLGLCKACVMGEGYQAFVRTDQYNMVTPVVDLLTKGTQR